MKSSREIRVGFGPVTNSNSFFQSGLKVAKVLGSDTQFTCGFFQWQPFDFEELSQFDILIFIKYLPDKMVLAKLKENGTQMYLDYHDTFLCPSIYEDSSWRRILKYILYYPIEVKTRKKLTLLNGCFYASPLLEPVLLRAGVKPLYLPRQIFNDENRQSVKKHSTKTSGLVIYWTGVGMNQLQNAPLLSMLKVLCLKYDCKLVYDTDEVKDTKWIEYRIFDRDTWSEKILDADIAFRWRDESTMQKYKDPNKVLSFMAAGLPTVIYPTESEKTLVQNGKTGFFAFSVETFGKIVERLICEPRLRARIGKEAHTYVWRRFSLEHHVVKLKNYLLDQ